MNIKAVLALAAALVVGTASTADAKTPISGKWRLTRAVIAPWATDAEAGVRPDWIGETVTFGRASVKAPGPLACGGARYENTDVPPEGLFQGGLPEPAAQAMLPLGLSDEAIAGVTVTCDTGIFEFHFASADSLLFALDNRIWTLDRTPGTKASKTSPEGVVQRLLEAHFSGDMGFSPASVEAKKSALSDALRKAIAAYFARPADPNEAPPINGDPFTDSQDYPARFAVRLDDKKAKGVAVPVEFSDAFRKRTVLFLMARDGGRWLVDDLQFEDGSTLTGAMAE